MLLKIELLAFIENLINEKKTIVNLITMDKELEQFECKLCGKTLGSKEEMKKHAAEVHHKH